MGVDGGSSASPGSVVTSVSASESTAASSFTVVELSLTVPDGAASASCVSCEAGGVDGDSSFDTGSLDSVSAS